ncbi:MAG: hypothetical protein RL757_605 [Bacteroidota bacterium]|jgi:adenine-specific DNA-methyltransferase
MRFIGNKENLVEKIYQIMQQRGIKGDSFIDLFAGTASVSKFFKKQGYQIQSADLLYCSFVLQKAYIQNNELPTFQKLISKLDITSNDLFADPLTIVVQYLNHLPLKEGFIAQNYTPRGTAHLEIPRMYFSEENGLKIDTIRQQIEEWKNHQFINEQEYFILLACLIETVPFYANIAGVYAAFHKKWDVRAVKKMELRSIEVIVNGHENHVFHANSIHLLKKLKTDILYLDPPYNQRQYAPNYHLLETIALYDAPTIKGVSGMRPYEHQKSVFCNAQTALIALKEIAEKIDYQYLMLSYNSEGIMPQEKIIKTLEAFGKVELVEFDYLRFKSNSNGESKNKKFIKEQLYLLKKNEK